MELVKLETISPRKIWENEAYDFTPWLVEHTRSVHKVFSKYVKAFKS